MSRRARAAALILFAIWPAAVAQSWTDATRTRMIRDALKVSPPALRTILAHYEKDLVRGMLEPSKRETEEIHFQHADGKGGLAAFAIDGMVRDIRNRLSERAPFGSVTYEMGVLAHLVADVEFPLNASDADPREPLYSGAYTLFIERSLERIPFVVDRLPPPALEKGDVRGFVGAIAKRAAGNYPLIGGAFKDDGTPRTRDALDDRSVPFGIASLSYSHSTSDIAWIWRHVWVSINGDMRGTPFLGDPAPERVQVPAKPKRTPPAVRPPPPTARASPRAPGPEGSPAPPAARASPAPPAGGTPAPPAAGGGGS